jgi:hypothetical protein
MRLSVPLRRQLADGYCLPACVEMVLAARRIEQDQAALARALGTLPDVGTPISAITNLTSRIRELRTLNISFHQTGEPHDLELALDAGIPPILRVITSQLAYWPESTPHAVVLVDLTNEIAQVNDPAFDDPKYVSFAELCLAWDDGGNRYALIR